MIAIAGNSRGWRRALLVSIALNLFLAALVGAHLARKGWGAEEDLNKPHIERMAATLPAADAAKLRAQFQADEAIITPARAAYRAARDKVGAAFLAEPFDPAAADRALKELREVRFTLEIALHQALTKAAQQMSPAGRAKIATWTPDR